ncbi:MAG: penicillin-binding protein 2 [Acidobacteria bacterium]|nr:MAG: penicillin-binding protein 2 [Acidobacteriota bacterium]
MRIYEDLRSLQSRLSVIKSVIVLALALVVVYFWHLQVVRGKYFRELADNNRIRAVAIPAPRGPVFDRNGRVLVENRSSFNVVLSAEPHANLDAELERVGRIIEVDEEQVRDRIDGRGPRFKSVVAKADASEEDVAVVEARRLEEPEVGVEVVPLRAYPLTNEAAHVLGRVGEVTDRQLATSSFSDIEPGTVVGQAGIEAQYNRALMGRDGVRRVVVNSRGVEVAEAQQEPPVPGPPGTLTIDVELQRAMDEAMGGRPGGAVALDPQTGEILALSSNPAYDPNVFSGGISPAVWQGLIKDPETPLMNRVIQGQYAPGSAFKVVMSIAALDAGVITPGTRFHCPGFLNIYGKTFLCHKKEGHGTLNMIQALAQSCNVYFYNVGVRLEIQRISRYANLLGFNAPSGIDLPYEASGLIPSPEWKMRTQKVQWFPGETVSVSIGQGGVTVTAIQMARLAAAVGNGGRLVQPHLIKTLNGAPVEFKAPVDLGLKPSTIAAVKQGMSAVVAPGGTGWRAQLPGIRVAGKTGSAQVVTHARLETDKKSHQYQPHGWFLCFAPIDHPRIAMAVMVEHGTAGGQSAAPIAGQILAHFFGVPPPPATTVPPPTPVPPGRPRPLPSPGARVADE